MHTTAIWEWLRSFPFGQEARRLTPPGPYIEYRRANRLTTYCMCAAVLLAMFFSPIRHAPIAVRTVSLLLIAFAIGTWTFAGIRYVLAWDELQRRALAESGAITAAILLAVMVLYALAEKFFGFGERSAVVWFFGGFLLWCIALPLVRRHYEA